MSSNGRFTVTLGESGQIVKRARPPSGVIHCEIGVVPSGSKHDLREKLARSTSQSKRQRTENGSSTMKDSYSNSYCPVGHNDLRLKLIHKQQIRGSEAQREEYLREKLFRKRQVSLISNFQQSSSDSGAQQNSRVGSFDPVKLLPSRRSLDGLFHHDSLRKPYLQPLDGKRHISQGKLTGLSRPMSSHRSSDEMQHTRIARPMDVPRYPTLMTDGVTDSLRPGPSTNRTIVPADAAKPVVRAPPPTITSIAPRSPHQPETPVTVSGLLSSLGLEKYGVNFTSEEVDMAALRQMGESDLKELGIPMGPRKKILLALLRCSKQQHR